MLCGSFIKIWNLANQMKKQKKKHQNAKSIGEKLKTKVWCSLFHFFHVICKISNSNMWTAKHLAQASCTELTLMQACFNVPISIFNFQPNEKVENNKYPITWHENSNSTLEIFWHQFQFIAHSINKSIQLKKSLKFVTTISDYSLAWFDFENFLSCHYLCRAFICTSKLAI